MGDVDVMRTHTVEVKKTKKVKKTTKRRESDGGGAVEITEVETTESNNYPGNNVTAEGYVSFNSNLQQNETQKGRNDTFYRFSGIENVFPCVSFSLSPLLQLFFHKSPKNIHIHTEFSNKNDKNPHFQRKTHERTYKKL